MTLLRLTGRMLINVSSLSTEGAVGNYNPLQRASVIFRKKPGSKELDVSEVPVITGNMLKHWHAMAVRDLEVAEAKSSNRKPILCEDCIRGVMMRTRLPDKSEHRYLQKCVVDDLHGFLLAGEELAMRRDSLVKFGNTIPIEEHVRNGVPIDPLIHNRVVLERTGSVSREYMMPFRREYTSTCFALYAAADLTYVGVPMADPYTQDGRLKLVINRDERLRRVRAAIEAFEVCFTSVQGAGSSRSLPHAKLLEGVALIGSGKIAPLISAFYEDYVEQMLSSLPEPRDDLAVVVYNIDIAEEMTKFESKYGPESELVKRLREWQGKIYETKAITYFFRIIKEKALEFSKQEPVEELTEEGIKKLEEEIGEKLEEVAKRSEKKRGQ